MTSVEAHRRSQELVALAEQAAAGARVSDAAALYLQAAEEETRAFETIPVDRVRTRGIIAVSATALYRKAGAPAEVVGHAQRYLSHPELPEFARRQLQEMLAEAEPALRRVG